MNEVIKWLIEGPPWVEYLTRIGLLGQQESDPEVATARHRMLIQPEIKNLLSELSEWPGPALKRHNDLRLSLTLVLGSVTPVLTELSNVS